jgi:hypothetical protein
MNFFKSTKHDEAVDPNVVAAEDLERVPNKSFIQRLFPVLAAGSGLFSEGYITNVWPFESPGEVCSRASGADAR